MKSHAHTHTHPQRETENHPRASYRAKLCITLKKTLATIAFFSAGFLKTIKQIQIKQHKMWIENHDTTASQVSILE